MKRYRPIFFYTVAALLCAAGVLTAVVGETWAGRLPPAPETAAGASAAPEATPAEVGKNLSEGMGGNGGASFVLPADIGIFWVTVYARCGHERVREEPPDPQMVGKTLGQFAACYPAYAMTVEGGHIRMSRTIDQYCPNHYYIQSDENGKIYVYRNLDGLDKLTIVKKLDFGVEKVPEDYWPLLAEGMAFGSIEEIEGLIEDAET